MIPGIRRDALSDPHPAVLSHNGIFLDSECIPSDRRQSAVTLSLRQLTVTDFRCYAHLRLDVDSRPVVLTGPNGAGKTNLLEAISFLVPGSGLRGATLVEVARRNSDATDQAVLPWAVAAVVQTPDGIVGVGTGTEASSTAAVGRPRRKVHIDGETAPNQAALAGVMSVQWLTPIMDRLFTDGASGRRRFLDRLVYGFDAAHAGRVSAYGHAMRERALLLRQGSADTAWLVALEETMAAKGIAIAAARAELVAKLNQALAEKTGPFPRADVAMQGIVEKELEDYPALEAEERLQRILAENRPSDAASGRTGVGPHKSDFIVRHVGKDQLAADCSTGEQKATLIAVMLACAALQADGGRGVPVLLLDEVVAHLDQQRREALYDEILMLKTQAWLTGTDDALFRAFGAHAQYFHVEDAEVSAN